MKTKAVRLYGKKDLRLEEFELPPVKDNEILAKVICSSLSMSSYDALKQGTDHRRIPDNIAQYPVIIGHELGGELLEVGSKWAGAFKAGDKFTIYPGLNHHAGPVGLQSAPGYSYPYMGGDATYVIISNEVMESGCLMPYLGPGYYPASLSKYLSRIIGAIHTNYHTIQGSSVHQMGIVHGGNMAILAGVDFMGLTAINYVLHRQDRKPSLLVVTDVDQRRLDQAAMLYTVEYAATKNIELKYVNTATMEDSVRDLMHMTGNKGYDDVFVFEFLASVVEQAYGILGFDGCLNFFAGVLNADSKAQVNFQNGHDVSKHVVNARGGNIDDMKEGLELLSKGLDPAGLVTHIGGLNAVVDATLNLPNATGGKKLIYNHLEMPLTPIVKFRELGKNNAVYCMLAEVCDQYNGVWSVEAEELLLANATALNY
jgi:threonine dehydrogenase-like Zn-dependent dehydrogenase